jgi:hypothetical protein
MDSTGSSPKTDGLAASHTFQFAKFYKVAKRESSIGGGVSLADQLGVKHGVVVKIDVGPRDGYSDLCDCALRLTRREPSEWIYSQPFSG